MKPTDLRNVLNKEFRHQYDFLYLPADGTVRILSYKERGKPGLRLRELPHP